MEKMIKPELIVNYMKEKNISKNQLCKMAHIGLASLNAILNGDHRKILQIMKIAEVMNIRYTEFYYPVEEMEENEENPE